MGKNNTLGGTFRRAPPEQYSSYIDKLRNFSEFQFAASHMVGDFQNFPTEFPRAQNSRIGIPI